VPSGYTSQAIDQLQAVDEEGPTVKSYSTDEAGKGAELFPDLWKLQQLVAAKNCCEWAYLGSITCGRSVQ
jgi:hypothetical protein